MQDLRKLWPAEREEEITWAFDHIEDEEAWLEYAVLASIREFFVKQKSLKAFLKYAEATYWTANLDVEVIVDEATLFDFHAGMQEKMK